MGGEKVPRLRSGRQKERYWSGALSAVKKYGVDAAFLADWLNLILRWAHLIVGIAWIGASFYFIWLDNHLKPPLDPADAAKGIGGEV